MYGDDEENTIGSAKMIDRIMTLRNYTRADPGSSSTYVHTRNRSHPDIAVRFLLHDRRRVGVKDIRQFIEDISEHSHVFFVTNGPLTLYASRELYAISDVHVEHWLTSELIQDPTKHRYYCPHRIVSKRRKRQLKTSTLPSISHKDIICRFLGARRGNVLEIVRTHPNGFHYVVMRLVV